MYKGTQTDGETDLTIMLYKSLYFHGVIADDGRKHVSKFKVIMHLLPMLLHTDLRNSWVTQSLE